MLEPSVHAKSEWSDNGPIDIWIDNAKDGDIPCVIHELLHVYFEPMLRKAVDSELEEAIILGLEKWIMHSMTPKSQKWWRDEINRRLK